jgi:hypothetical protein
LFVPHYFIFCLLHLSPLLFASGAARIDHFFWVLAYSLVLSFSSLPTTASSSSPPSSPSVSAVASGCCRLPYRCHYFTIYCLLLGVVFLLSSFSPPHAAPIFSEKEKTTTSDGKGKQTLDGRRFFHVLRRILPFISFSFPAPFLLALYSQPGKHSLTYLLHPLFSSLPLAASSLWRQ